MELKYASPERDADACYPLMKHLRPHLSSVEDFAERWSNQQRAGYRLLVLWNDDVAVAAAGFRVQENFMHGRYLYVDDLVTDPSSRSSGHGKAVLDRVVHEGRALGCNKILLDTPVSNSLGQRFYFRQGLFVTAFRFTQEIA